MKKLLTVFLSVILGITPIYSTAVSAASTKVYISNEADFLSIADNPGYTYELLGDITLETYETIPDFSGTLNGNGYQIVSNGKMLFDVVESGAVIQDLSVVSDNISGETNVGAVAGTLYGTIRRVDVTAKVNASSTAGVIAGLVSGGTISDSCADGSVSASNGTVGGLVGKAENANIERCYSTVLVSGGDTEKGGFI